MSTRQIKDAKDLSTNELIYFKGHAQATYMSDGRTVEEAVNSISESGGSIDTSNFATKDELAQKQDVISDIDTIRTNASNYKGTITGVSANGTSVATSGVANIPAATTSKYGVTKLSSATNSTSTTLAATASAVKAAYDLANSYKGTVTGVKINGTTKSPTSGVVDLGTVITAHQTLKTINGESIVGSGNITIEGGSGSSSNNRIAVLEISTLVLDNQFAEYGYQLDGVAEECETIWENICESTSISELFNYLDSNYSIVINDSAYIRPCSIVYDSQGGEIYITLPGYTTTNTQYSVNQYTYEILINDREDIILLHRYHHTQVSSAYTEINHGTDNTTWDLAPNTFNIWGEVPELYLTLMSETPNIANEFVFQFTSGSEPTTLTIDNIIGDTDIKWVNDEAPVIEANKIYQISILKGLGSVMSWEVEVSIAFPITLEMGSNGENGVLLYNYLADTYGQATAGTVITEEIYNNGFGTSLLVSTIEYGEYGGYTGYWLNDYGAMKVSWVLQSDGYMIRITPEYDS